VGLRKMQTQRWDFVQNVIIVLGTLAQAKRGAGGVGMPPPNWNRQLWRHQCRSHFPANPDGPVAMPEAGYCNQREGGRGELIFFGSRSQEPGTAPFRRSPRVPPLDHSTAFRHCSKIHAAQQQNISLQTNDARPTRRASPRFHLCIVVAPYL
jgi:hypothetical protein